MDEDEFRRRIEIYLERDLPEVEGRDRIASALAARLWQYVEHRPVDLAPSRRLLHDLVAPERTVLFFDATWNGTAAGYWEEVSEIAEEVGARPIQIDIDDPLGATVARSCEIANVPAVVIVHGAERTNVVGRRSPDELRGLIRDD